MSSKRPLHRSRDVEEHNRNPFLESTQDRPVVELMLAGRARGHVITTVPLSRRLLPKEAY